MPGSASARSCPCSARRHIFLCHKGNPLASQEEYPSCVTGGHFVVRHRKDFSCVKNIMCCCATRRNISSCVARQYPCVTRRDFFLRHRENLLLATREEISSCVARRHCACVSEEGISSCDARSDFLASCKDIRLVTHGEVSSSDTGNFVL